jgi:hypothetical protein
MNTYTGVLQWMEMPIEDMLEWHKEVQDTIRESEEQVKADMQKQ